MKKKAEVSRNSEKIPVRPALTPEARENQLIAEAMDLVEQRILNGTASAQETTHFLKLGSMKSRYQNELLQMQCELTKVKTEAIESNKRTEEFYQKVLDAMQLYSGNGDYDG